MSPDSVPRLRNPSVSGYVVDGSNTEADARHLFSGHGQRTQSDQDLEHTFELERALMIDQAIRASKLNKEAARQGLRELELPLDVDEALRGGVGYGMYFSSAFQSNWARGTAIIWDIACPMKPGGNVETFLYITATNRSSRGVEALIAYRGQNEIGFHIFDWARPANDRWRHFAFSGLAPYLRTMNIGSIHIQILPLMNMTFIRAGGQWSNEVWLQNQEANRWDIVYQFDYQSNEQDQHNPAIGFWGPIIETFQPHYAGTNSMGALNTKLTKLIAGGIWAPWQNLSTGQSKIQADEIGFQLNLISPNDSWLAAS